MSAAPQRSIAHERQQPTKIIVGNPAVLILSRRKGESFLIGENIKITVLSQRSNQVRIGIEAPRSMPVQREELLIDKGSEGAERMTAALADACE